MRHLRAYLLLTSAFICTAKAFALRPTAYRPFSSVNIVHGRVLVPQWHSDITPITGLQATRSSTTPQPKWAFHICSAKRTPSPSPSRRHHRSSACTRTLRRKMLVGSRQWIPAPAVSTRKNGIRNVHRCVSPGIPSRLRRA